VTLGADVDEALLLADVESKFTPALEAVGIPPMLAAIGTDF
jgi:hypothetical protein